MSDKHNMIPMQCAGICGLEQDDVDRNGITLTRNCKGPSLGDTPITSRVIVEGGEAILEIPVDDAEQMLAFACTNAGFERWLKAKRKALTP